MYWQREEARYHVSTSRNGQVFEEGYTNSIGDTIQFGESMLKDRCIDSYWIVDLTKEPGKGIVWRRGI